MRDEVGQAADWAQRQAKWAKEQFEAAARFARDKGVAWVKGLIAQAWEKIRSFDCGSIVDGVSKIVDPVAIVLKDLWRPAGTCYSEVKKGFFCAIPDFIQDALGMLEGIAGAVWDNKGTCLVAGLATTLVGAPGAGTLLCGLGYWLYGGAKKIVSCFQRMGSEVWPFLLEEAGKQVCNLAGSLLLDAVIAAVSAGSSVPATVAKWIKKALDWVSPAKWLKVAARTEKVAVRIGKATIHLAEIFEKGVDVGVDYMKNVAKSSCEGVPLPAAPARAPAPTTTTRPSEPAPSTGPAKWPEGTPVATLKQSLALRGDAGGKKFADVRAGERVQYTGLIKGGWCFVRWYATAGWLWCDGLAREGGGAVVVKLKSKTPFREAVLGAHIRDLPKGNTVVRLGQTRTDWCKVSYQGRDGWVLCKALPR